MTATLAAVTVLGTCLAGFVQGLSGFAFGLMAMGIWAWSVEPQLAGPMVVWGSWVGQVLSLHSLKGRAPWRRALPFILGGFAGVPLGAWLLGFVDVRLFRGGVGALLVAYSTFMLLARHMPSVTRGGRVADGAVGAIGGVMGGLGGLTGPAPTLWCTLRGWDKDAQRGVFQLFNLAMHTLTLSVYVARGTVTAAMLPVFALMVPVAVLPTLAGVRLYRRVDAQVFRRVVLTLLLASGLALLLSLRGG